MGRRLPLAVAGLLAIGLGAVSCSSDTSGSTQTGLAKAMASVRNSAAARTYFEYGSPAALRELGVLHPAAHKFVDPKWNRVTGVGTNSLGTVSVLLRETLDLDVFTADTAVSIGQAPNVATRIDGPIKAAAVTAELRKFGAKPRTFGTVRGLSFGADNSVDPDSVLTQKLGVVNQLDQVSVTDDRFAASPNAATLEQIIDDPNPSLLDTAPYSDMADCLGDVLAAMVIATPSDRGVSLVGVGVRTPAAASATRHEVVCLKARAGASSTVRAALRKNTALAAADPTTNAPLSTYAAHTAVASDGPLLKVDLTMRAQTPPGFVIEVLFNRTISFWDGACTPRHMAVAHTC